MSSASREWSKSSRPPELNMILMTTGLRLFKVKIYPGVYVAQCKSTVLVNVYALCVKQIKCKFSIFNLAKVLRPDANVDG